MLQPVINLLQSNRLSEALVLCEQIMLKNKKNPDGWLLLADIYQKSGTFAKAEKSFRKAIKLKAVYAPAHTRLAMFYHGQGKFAKAEASYQQSLKLDNNQPTVHFNLGSVLQEQDKFDEALSQYQQAIKLKPDYAKAYANRGFVLRKQKMFDDAIDSYQQALRFAPEIAEIHYNMGLSLLNTGQAEAAEKHQRQALRLKANYADAWAGLASVQFFNGEIENAATSYQQALHQQPNDVDMLCGYASTLSTLGQHDQAMELVKQALNIEPDNAETCIAKGSIHVSLGQMDDALACCDQVLQITPQHEKAICLTASIYEKKGDSERAYHYLKPLLQNEHPATEVILSFASISKSLALTDDAIKRMEQLLQNSDKKIQATDSRRLHFTLGKAYDSQKDYDHAYKNFHTANKLKRAVFDIKEFKQHIDEQIKVFSAGYSFRLPKTSIRSDRPIFIVGMPRSGTSLVEQILASHPLISGAGELPDINNLVHSMPSTSGVNRQYPECIEQTDSQQLDRMAQAYLDTLSKVNSDARHVTDKMPGNFIHLGLIQLLFPDAHIIHCIRNPLDNCLSCYFQDFSQHHPWIYNLQDCGKVYLENLRMMQHWKSVLEIPILDIHYEGLVENQETISRKMIEFCDLDWDDACLQFHKSDRLIWTASYDQVRQPMYKKSVARWKNYEKHIEPLIEIFKTAQ